jgi:hypothetical protein
VLGRSSIACIRPVSASLRAWQPLKRFIRGSETESRRVVADQHDFSGVDPLY